MGCQESRTEEQKELAKKNKDADKMMKDRKHEMMGEIKLLLLGTGESGKSTIAKQMKILHTEGYSKQELYSFRPVVYNNVLSCTRTLLTVSAKFKIPVRPETQEFAKQLEAVNMVDMDSITAEMAEKVKITWKDPGIQDTYKRRNEYQLMDSAEYVFQNIDRFASPDFVPTEQDVLRVRARTTGIIETSFVIKETKFRMVDVGGQRSERKKWIHCFEDVTAIIYCVALNEYDMKLFEDEHVNRMAESLELFEEISNSKWFTKTAIILFLNKSDLFKEKVQHVPLSVFFRDYTVPAAQMYEHGIEFIQGKFIEANRNPNKKIFAHVTCATDTENVKVVFDAAKEIIISQNLERLGFGHL